MNKMKTASESIRFMRRMNTVPEEQMKKIAKETGHYEVEVEEEAEEEVAKIPQGEGLEELLGTCQREAWELKP